MGGGGWVGGVGSGWNEESGWWGGVRVCERGIEFFVKIKKNIFFGGGGSGGQGGCEQRIKVFVKIQKIHVCYFSMRNPYMKFQDDISFRNIIVAKFQGPKF